MSNVGMSGSGLEIDPERPLFEKSGAETKDLRLRKSLKMGFPDRSLVCCPPGIGAYIPLLASPQGGVAASSKNFAKPPKQTQPGWFSFLYPSENHPGLAIRGCCATF